MEGPLFSKERKRERAPVGPYLENAQWLVHLSQRVGAFGEHNAAPAIAGFDFRWKPEFISPDDERLKERGEERG